jgi:uncharacterized protein (UPF0248 family)
MQPIHELLNQIRWDPNFTGEFEVAFVDRARPHLQRVSVRRIHFTDQRFSFEILNDEDELVSIPLHRIRQVYRNGELIWNRPNTS